MISIQAHGAISGYWDESRRPLVSLVFVAPMLLAYEGGLLALGPRAMRNGADIWLRQLLEWIGLGQYFLLPITICTLLLAWHHLSHDRWKVEWSVLYGMSAECLLLGVLLIAVACMHGALLAELSVPAANLGGASWGRLVAFLGAGIYEELLFRLMLLPTVLAILRCSGIDRNARLTLAVVLTSLLFAAAHYRFEIAWGPLEFATEFGGAFEWSSFVFRFLAGALFSVVFLYRGFGIAVGTHALYDILVLAL